MSMQSETRRILADLDVAAARAAWARLFPAYPVPDRDDDLLTVLHVARTASDSLRMEYRAYSHRWLTERALPSQLPDWMKPAAERTYPKNVTAVGIAVRSQYPQVKDAIAGVMRDAVLDCYANGDDDPDIVRPRMQEARAREKKGLGLIRPATLMAMRR